MASLSCLFHPHHVRLRDKTSYQPLLPTPDDIYYAVERRPSHKGLFVPKFDVSENSQAFFLTGEFPGIVNKKQVTVEWLEEELLIVRARTDPLDLEMNWKIGRSTEQTRGDVQETQSVTNTSEKSQQHPPEFEQLLHERHVGQFERSFTFPTKVESSGMRAQLENGLLKIMVPKSSGEPKVKRQISIE